MRLPVLSIGNMASFIQISRIQTVTDITAWGDAYRQSVLPQR
jgi:hypothetical protein